MKKLFAAFASISCLLASVSLAQKPPEDPAHNELRALRTEVVEAITKGDIDAIIKHLTPDVVITWQNNEVCRGHQGVRDFFIKSGKQTFKGYKVPPTPDDLTILYNADTGVSFGTSVGQFNLLGKDYEFHNRWTATLVKENGRWLLASYHVSLNILDNPLLNAAKSAAYWIGGIALIVGLAVGLQIGKRRASAA